MDEHIAKGLSHKSGVRDRRYAIRYPFAADAELIDLETGTHATGVTSDISLRGCFVCSSTPPGLKARVRVTRSRKGESGEGQAVVLIVKPRIGLGIGFIDNDSSGHNLRSR